MPKDTLIALGAGVLAALAATAFLSRAPGALMLVYFADLPLFMAGFAFGPQAAAIGGAAGFMTAGLIGGGLAAGIFGIMQALPVWLVVRQLLLQRPAAVAGSAEPDGQIEWYRRHAVLADIFRGGDASGDDVDQPDRGPGPVGSGLHQPG